MIIGVLCVLGVVAFWSFTPFLIVTALQFVDPFTLAFLRLAQGLTLVVLLHRMRTGSFRGMFCFERSILMGSVGITINYVLFIVALNYTTASMGGLVVQIQFVTLAGLAWLVLREPFGAMKIAAVVVIIVGVSLVFVQERIVSDLMKPEYVLGNSVMLVAGVGWGVYAVSNKSLSRRKSNYEILIPIFSIATAVAFVAALIGYEVRATMTMVGLISIVILGTGVTGIGFLLMSTGLRRLNASLVGAITSVSPLFNILISHWLLGEPLSPMLFASAFVIIIGILGIIQADRSRSKRQAARPGP
jgi:drug/metabolite transporter (DMT)-like permease